MFKTTMLGFPLSFETSHSLFSPNGVDQGTRLMLEHTPFLPDDKVLDLGCGYGVVGICAAKMICEKLVTMSDIDALAVEVAKRNAALNGVPGIRVLCSDAFTDVDDAGYTLILSNPPYHTDFNVAKRFIEKGFNRLALGGRMVMVTKRRAWYENKLRAVFGGVSVREVDGYVILTAEKRHGDYAGTKRKAKEKNK